MRPPPPLRDAPQYPVTTAVAVASAGVTAAFLRGTRIDALTLDLRAFESQPWRLVSSTLPHVSVLHLLFNVLWLWSFGTVAEQRLGSVRYGGLLMLLAAGSGAADYALASGGVGLSGVVYGLFALLAILQRTDATLKDAVDDRVILLFVGWFFFCIGTTVTGWLAVANVAHGAGAALGALVALAMVSRGARRAGSIAMIALVVGAALVGDTIARARVNLASDRGSDAAYLAYHAYERGDLARAARYGRIAVRMNPSRADWWYNLGLAARRLHDEPTAIEALRKSITLDRRQSSAQVALADVYFQRAFREENAGRYESAVRGYREALDVQDSATTRFNLGTALEHLHQSAEAEASYRRAVALDPTPAHRSGLASWLFARAYEAGEAAHHDDAIRLGREALEFDPGSAPGWFNLGIEYEATSRWTEAADAFERAARIAPTETAYAQQAAAARALATSRQ